MYKKNAGIPIETAGTTILFVSPAQNISDTHTMNVTIVVERSGSFRIKSKGIPQSIATAASVFLVFNTSRYLFKNHARNKTIKTLASSDGWNTIPRLIHLLAPCEP